MRGRQTLGVVALAAVVAGCGAARTPRGATTLPREALPPTFEPLRWSVAPDELPALFATREAVKTEGTRPEDVVWKVADVRRVAGLAGTLRAGFSGRGDLASVRLTFADPRRDCDPDLGDRPRRCEGPAPALVEAYEALVAELSGGRGAPVVEDGAQGRSARWRGIGFALHAALARDARGAWRAEAVATPAPEDDAPTGRR